jgi:hypothetical protein
VIYYDDTPGGRGDRGGQTLLITIYHSHPRLTDNDLSFSSSLSSEANMA